MSIGAIIAIAYGLLVLWFGWEVYRAPTMDNQE